MSRLLRFIRDEDGPTAVEYAVMLAMIIMVCLAAIALVGENTAALWSDNEKGLQSAFNP